MHDRQVVNMIDDDTEYGVKSTFYSRKHLFYFDQLLLLFGSPCRSFGYF